MRISVRCGWIVCVCVCTWVTGHTQARDSKGNDLRDVEFSFLVQDVRNQRLLLEVTSSSGYVFGTASITVRRLFERADRLREVVELTGAVHGSLLAEFHLRIINPKSGEVHVHHRGMVERGILRVRCKAAQGLRNVDLFGKSDPYVLVNIRGHSDGNEYRTPFKRNTLSPVWNTQFEFVMDQPVCAAEGVPLVLHALSRGWSARDVF
eukprot:m.1356761 g.1356761  ORF g.1356761 m.1356761 type:complete len:207 (+) comp24933_c0_seq59:4373-4993(+)